MSFGGKVFGGYEFDKFLGRGSFGEVWLTLNRGKRYAVKVVADNDITGITEGELTQTKISCPFVMNYMTTFKDSSAPRKLFIVMEYCPRGNLQTVFDSMIGLGLVFDFNNIMKIFIQLGIGLYTIHGYHIIHRDIKPENVLLDEDYNVKIGDLGLARTMDTSTQVASTRTGTPIYMAPEMIAAGKISYDFKVDVFATGLLLFQLCAKQMPYGNIMDLALRKFLPFPKNQFPKWFCNIIYAMIDPVAEKRPTAKGILEDPFVQEYAGRLCYKETRLIALLNSDIQRTSSSLSASCMENSGITSEPSPPPSASSLVIRPPEIDADVAEFIETTAEENPSFNLADFRHEFREGIQRAPTVGEQNYFKRLVKGSGGGGTSSGKGTGGSGNGEKGKSSEKAKSGSNQVKGGNRQGERGKISNETSSGSAEGISYMFGDTAVVIEQPIRHFAVLGLTKKATVSEVKAAFKRMICTTNRPHRATVSLAYVMAMACVRKLTIPYMHVRTVDDSSFLFDAKNPIVWVLAGYSTALRALYKADPRVKFMTTAFKESLLYLATRSGMEDVVECVFEMGCEVNDMGNGKSALHAATSLGFESLTRYLIARGADPAARRREGGKTPLDEAATPTLQRAVTVAASQPMAAFIRSVLAENEMGEVQQIRYGGRVVAFRMRKWCNWDEECVRAWQGTRQRFVASILKHGLRKPGDPVGSTTVSIPKGHIPPGAKVKGVSSWGDAIFLSRAVKYACEPAYAERIPSVAEGGGGGDFCVLVEAKVNPGSYTEYESTAFSYTPRPMDNRLVEMRVTGSVGITAITLVSWEFINTTLLPQDALRKLLTGGEEGN